MVGNVILYFSTLSAAFRLKAPLPPYLPPAEKSRQELVSQYLSMGIFKFYKLTMGATHALGECDTQLGCCQDPECDGFAAVVVLCIRTYDEGGCP